MKIISYIISTICVAGLLLGSCSMTSGGSVSNGDAKDATVKKTVKIGSFDKIEAASGIKVIFTQGKATGIAQVATTPSAEKYLKVKVSNGVLSVRYENKSNHNIYGPSIVTVVSPQLTDVDLSSAATLQVRGNLDLAGKLSFDMSSASRAVLGDVTAREIDVDLSSSASVSIGKANVNKLESDLSSASKLTIEKVIAQEMELDTSSAAKISVGYFNGNTIEAEASSASSITVAGITADNAYAEASSGGKVSLKGKCRSISRSTSSGGRIDTSHLNAPGATKNKKRGHAPVQTP